MPTSKAASRSSRRGLDPSIGCMHCQKSIRSVDQLLLLQSCDATPESGSAVTVHAACADAFTDEHPGTWKRYTGRSSSASWFLPLMVRWPDASRRSGHS